MKILITSQAKTIIPLGLPSLSSSPSAATEYFVTDRIVFRRTLHPCVAYKTELDTHLKFKCISERQIDIYPRIWKDTEDHVGSTNDHLNASFSYAKVKYWRELCFLESLNICIMS